MGTVLQFIAMGSYTDGGNQNITNSVNWTSSSTSVGTINASGLATGISAGNTVIKATSGSVAGSTSLTVVAPDVTLGNTAIGATIDSSDSNFISASRFTVGAQGGAVNFVAVYIAAPVSPSPNNLFQVAIYSDTNGSPGSLIGASVSQTIAGNAWNAAAVTATLSPNTAYWLAYNTNGASAANNNLALSSGGTYVWRNQAFASWPATFGAPSGTAVQTASIYASLNSIVDTTPPSVPTGIAATPAPYSVVLTWAASTDPDSPVAGYQVLRGPTSSNLIQIGTIVNTSYTDSSVSPSTIYYYAVAAYDPSNNVSATSSPLAITTPADTTPPSVPGGISATSTSSSVTLTWSASTDPDSPVAGYQVFRGPTPTNLTQIATATSLSYNDSSLSPSTTYYYALAAYDPSNNVSAKSSALAVTTQPAGSTFTLGNTAIGQTVDSSDSNYMSGSIFAMGAQSGTVSSISVYVAAPVSSSPNNLLQVAIYSDLSGTPGSLIAASSSQALTPDAWNTVSILAVLSGNTSYWLFYNTNGFSAANNNLVLSPGSTYGWKAQAFGSWPASFGVMDGSSPQTSSIYATLH
jgi:hypothetical protein